MRTIKTWALATFLLTFLVILAGGVVRTTQSGMGCPDFPTCFGKWIPPMNASELPPDFEKYLRKQDIDHTFNAFHTWTEYGNRLVGALLGLFGIIQCLLLYRKRKILPQTWRLSLAFLAVVIGTGLFGALVVKLNLAHLSISVHLLLAVALAQIQLALFLSLSRQLFSIVPEPSLKKAMLLFLFILFAQSVLGTMVRMYVDDVSKVLHYEKRETWLADTPIAFLIHRTFSWIVLLSAVFLLWRYRASGFIKKLQGLFVLMLLNMIAGITLFYADMPAIAQPLHLLLATLCFTQLFNIIFRLKRPGS